MLLSEMSDALLSFKDLFLCHALESLLPVLVHVDLELVKEVLGLDVRAVFVENVAVFDIRLAIELVWREVLLPCRIPITVLSITDDLLVSWSSLLIVT